MDERFDNETDEQIIEKIRENPEDIAKLLSAKRKANAEAKTYRERLEAVEKEVAELETSRIYDTFAIEALQARIRPDRLDVALRLAELDHSADDVSEGARSAVRKLKEGFPELFLDNIPPPTVDNAGFSRHKLDDYASAKSAGDPMAMLRALRKRP
ncbi:MAG TPA: hypothetical protein ENN07_04680 [candidate division Zixibacteria bacterium]|nr:hypothetical protein [candidate division Zixibacteria bacterium]